MPHLVVLVRSPKLLHCQRVFHKLPMEIIDLLSQRMSISAMCVVVLCVVPHPPEKNMNMNNSLTFLH